MLKGAGEGGVTALYLKHKQFTKFTLPQTYSTKWPPTRTNSTNQSSRAHYVLEKGAPNCSCMPELRCGRGSRLVVV